MFYFSCLYKTGNFDISIKKSSFNSIFTGHPFVYCCSFSSSMVNKMADFCDEKLMLDCRFSFRAYVTNVREKATKCSLKTTEVLLDSLGSLIFIKIQQLQIALRARRTLDVLIFFKKMFCLIAGLKFTRSNVTSFLPDNIPGLKKNLSSPDL